MDGSATTAGIVAAVLVVATGSLVFPVPGATPTVAGVEASALAQAERASVQADVSEAEAPVPGGPPEWIEPAAAEYDLTGVEGVVRTFRPVCGPEGVLLLGYGHYATANPLDNETRKRVYDAIDRSPGTYTTRISDVEGVARSTVRYHTHVLERAGLVTSEKTDGKQRFFPSDCDEIELCAALADPAAAAILDALARTGPVNCTRLAEVTDRAPSTISYHLKRLAAVGLVEQTRDGTSVRNELSTRGALELDAGAGDAGRIEEVIVE